MKNLGLAIAFIGICLVGASFTFTPSHAFNVADSVNGIKASAPMFFTSLIIFGSGVVVYASAVMPRPKHKK